MARDIQLGRLSNGRILSLPLHVLKERHFAIQGATGQRKTLFALSLLVQFLQHRTHCVVYIDIGGDNAAYWILKEACDKAGKKMHLFSLMKDHDSLYFDPLVSSRALIADRQVAANSITQGLTLVFSEGYGRNYWGRVNQAEVNEGLDNLTVNTAALKELARTAEDTS